MRPSRAIHFQQHWASMASSWTLPHRLPASGVTPYRIQTPLWSDGAEKLRFVYLPAGTKAKAQGVGLLDLPVGAALIKTFKLEGRLIETRVLLHRADGWVALPYQWNREQTEARLALAGARLELATPQGQAISYAIPNKNQCKECHQQKDMVVPIGPKARNLSVSWLTSFHQAGELDAVPKVTSRVPLWEDRAKLAAAPVARGWLDSNCAHCHNPGGSASNSGLDLRWEQSDPVKLGIMKRPVAAGRGSGGLEFDVVPGARTSRSCFTAWAALKAASRCPKSAAQASIRMGRRRLPSGSGR